MDNLGKALHIGVGVLLFIIALTSSIIMYGRLMDYVEAGIRVSDDGRRAEISSSIYEYNERKITHSEVIMSLVQIHSTNANKVLVKSKGATNYKQYLINNTVAGHEILVNGASKNINEYEFHKDVSKGVYTYSYSEVDKTITYEWESDI